jgi:hypothetical protein
MVRLVQFHHTQRRSNDANVVRSIRRTTGPDPDVSHTSLLPFPRCSEARLGMMPETLCSEEQTNEVYHGARTRRIGRWPSAASIPHVRCPAPKRIHRRNRLVLASCSCSPTYASPKQTRRRRNLALTSMEFDSIFSIYQPSTGFLTA